MTAEEFLRLKEDAEKAIKREEKLLDWARSRVIVPDQARLRPAGSADLEPDAILYGGFDPSYDDEPYFLIVREGIGNGYFWADDGCTYCVEDGFFVEKK